MATLVEGCTDAMPEPGQEKAPWIERKLAYLEHLAHAGEDARLISLCDKLHNARAIVGDVSHAEDAAAVWDRFNQGPPMVVWYYRSVLAVTHDTEHRRLRADLKTTVEELAKLAGV